VVYADCTKRLQIKKKKKNQFKIQIIQSKCFGCDFCGYKTLPQDRAAVSDTTQHNIKII